MRYTIIFFLLLASGMLAQTDTVNLQKVRFEANGEAGIAYGSSSVVNGVPEHAGIFLNNDKNFGTNVQAGIHTYLFNKVILQLEYAHDNLRADGNKIISQMTASDPNYFIQAEPEYARSEAWSFGNYDLNYLKAGLAANLKLSKSRYLQPYACYAVGKGKIPEGKFAFKDNSSNHFYVNEYSFENVKAYGLVVGMRFKYFVDGFDKDTLVSAIYSHIALKIEFASMQVAGAGRIVRTDSYTQFQTVRSFDFGKSYQYVTVGISLGLGHKGRKYGRAFFFSTYPIKPPKTFKQRFQKNVS